MKVSRRVSSLFHLVSPGSWGQGVFTVSLYATLCRMGVILVIFVDPNNMFHQTLRGYILIEKIKPIGSALISG